ncbi:uncharacterized protein LOC124929486 [Impatiens glandulifera]|uniref:uncharacterized protein LOC124929486 n=1 Tax=Impatiens glandulifera TaxID=253017 RepID=UPI001FB09F68|nr:uncharacterized protein LOC124929486 [Impatiens glandulifera]
MAALQPQLLIIIFFFFLFLFSSCFSSSQTDTPTVFEILPKYGLPSGLLPNSVKSYSLSSEGDFVVELENPCYIHFEYLVYYETKISGKLKYGSITVLKGIQVQRFLLWFDVDDIRVDLPPSDSIYFQVGMINKRLDIDQFQTLHNCSRKAISSSSPPLINEEEIQLQIPKDDIEMLLLTE